MTVTGTAADGLASNGALLGRQTQSSKALWDLKEGLARRWIWQALAWHEIKLRYRGSIIGPFWITLSTLILVSAMGALYSRLLNSDISVYVPFLTTGLVLWQFISQTIVESCETFVSLRGVILQIPMPYSIYVYRIVWRNLLVLCHSLILVPIAWIAFRVPLDWHLVLFLPGLAVVALNGVWICFFLGQVCTRFADIRPIVVQLVQIIFFVTPIFWQPESLGRFKIFAELNPLFAAVDICRSPLLGHAPAPYSWWVMLATLAIGGAGAFAFFTRFRSRIAYWI